MSRDDWRWFLFVLDFRSETTVQLEASLATGTQVRLSRLITPRNEAFVAALGIHPLGGIGPLLGVCHSYMTLFDTAHDDLFKRQEKKAL